MKFKAHLECDTNDFIVDVPLENLKGEDVEYNIRMKLYELASVDYPHLAPLVFEVGAYSSSS